MQYAFFQTFQGARMCGSLCVEMDLVAKLPGAAEMLKLAAVEAPKLGKKAFDRNFVEALPSSVASSSSTTTTRRKSVADAGE